MPPNPRPPPRHRHHLTLLNRQRRLQVNVRLLRRILLSFLAQFGPEARIELGAYLVDTAEITRLNEKFVRHQGSTDVITFDYSEFAADAGAAPESLAGEIFVCADEAVAQARRFHTSWQSELVRYFVHGVLHLSGYDDRQVHARRRMKLAENQWVRRLGAEFSFEALMKPPRRDGCRENNHLSSLRSLRLCG